MTTSDIAAARRTTTPGRTTLLRTALKLDATVSALVAVAFLAGAAPLDDLLGLPAGAIRAIGAFLVVFAAGVWYVGSRPAIPRRGAWCVIAVNDLWVAASIAEAVTGWGSPTTTGTAVIVLQAVAVAGIATLEWAGLKRGSAA